MRIGIRNRFGVLRRLLAYSLSGRLLALTCLFMLVSEALVIPVLIGNHHLELVKNRIRSAESAVLPFNEAQWHSLPISLRRTLLDRLDADAVMLDQVDYKEFYFVVDHPPPPGRIISLSAPTLFRNIGEGLNCLLIGNTRTLHVYSPTTIKGAKRIGVILNEAPIRAELIDYAVGIVWMGLIILVLIAVLIFVSIYKTLVAPMRRIIRSMAAFRANPEDAGQILVVSDAAGEIGQAERELSAMQRDLFAYLHQQTRLAALGGAVARIQHDLRNILATAQLTSDRLTASEDPAVKRLAPGLIAAIDRANGLATSTLKYVRSQERVPEPARFALAPLIAEAVQSLTFTGTVVEPSTGADLSVCADRDHLFRAILNLTRNAAAALADRQDGVITISVRRVSRVVEIDIADNGKGIPPKVRESLFQPFAMSSSGGSGLGLAIARELMRGCGGDVVLIATGSEGTSFRISLPAG